MNIHESLQKVYDAPDLLGSTFYDVFFKKHPEVQQFFEGVDMKRQAIVLTMALTLVEQYDEAPFRATEDYLHFLGVRHDQRQIPRDLYPSWLDAMLETLQQFHQEQWSDELANQWRHALETSIRKMLEAYQPSPS